MRKEKAMSEPRSQFVYVTYIRAAPERIWDALTQPEFTRAYWNGVWHDAEWRAGGSWKLMFPDGRIADAGEVVEYDPPRRLVLRWRNEFRPELRDEGHSRCVITLEAEGETTKLTIDHSIDRENAKIIAAVSNGWPRLMASLKSLLETGAPLPEPALAR
jgi:uncharacterized protein YndB with AHSA1/START domain